MSQISGIHRRFSHSAASYDDHAATQRHIAHTLCADIELAEGIKDEPIEILELGCGTGFLTLALLEKFPTSNITITDISADMLAQTRRKLETLDLAAKQSITISELDFTSLGDKPEDITKRYDLIAASMVVHWSDDIDKTLKTIAAHLKPNGRFYFSSIGQGAFKEWQASLESCGLRSGLRLPPELPAIYKSEEITTSYENAAAFLNELRQTGAHGPRSGYTPLSPRQLKDAMAALEDKFNAALTWEINYGCLTAREQI